MLDELAGSIILNENWKGEYNGVLGSTGACVRELVPFTHTDETTGLLLLPKWADHVYRCVIDTCVRRAKNSLSTEVAVRDALRFTAAAECHADFFERARAACTAFDVDLFAGLLDLIKANPGDPRGVRGWRRRYERSRVKPC